MLDLDHAFKDWDGTLNNHVFINPRGKMTVRPDSPDLRGVKFRWFLSNDAQGEIVLVVLLIDPGLKLPQIVTAYRPSAKTITDLYELLASPEFQNQSP